MGNKMVPKCPLNYIERFHYFYSIDELCTLLKLLNSVLLEEERDCLATQCLQNQAEITKLKTMERISKQGIISAVFEHSVLRIFVCMAHTLQCKTTPFSKA